MFTSNATVLWCSCMQLPIIENKGKFKFERIGAPQPQDMARVSADRAMEMLRDVEPNVVPYFM